MNLLVDDQRKELERFRFVTDGAMEAIYWVQEDGRFVYVNHAACKMLGYKREQLLQLRVEDIDPEYPNPIWRAHWQRMKNQKFLQIETQHVTAAAETRTVSMEIRFYEFDGDEFIVGSARDVTEQKQTQLRLEKTQQSIDTAVDVVMWINPLGDVTYANRAACKLLQYSQDELLSMNVADFNTDLHSPADFQEQIWPRIEKEGSLQVQLHHQRRDGKVFPVEISTHKIEFGDEVFTCSFVRDLSEKYDAEKRFNELAASNQAMIDLLSVSDGMLDWQVGTDQANFAAGWRKMLGFQPDDLEAVPNSISALEARIHPADQARYQEALQACLSSGRHGQTKPLAVEFRIRNADERFIWLRLRAMPSYANNGVPVRLVGSAHDITEEKESAADLALAERQGTRSQFFVDNSKEAIYWLGKDSRFTYVNNAACEMLGYSRDALLKLHAADVDPNFPPDSWPATWEQLRQDRFMSLRTRHRRSDGEKIWVEARVHFFELDGEEYVVGVARDISEEVTANRKLRENEELLQAAMTNAEIGLWTLDVRTGEVSVNETLNEQLGYPPDLPWRTLADWEEKLHPEDVSAAKETVKAVLEDDRSTYNNIFRLRTPEGEYRWIRSVGKMVHDEDGSPMRLIGVHIDINDLKLSEAKLRGLNENLERSNAELEQFAYVASHDLRTPLRSINTLAFFLLRDDSLTLSEPASEKLRRLQSQVVQMEELLDDLLEYSRAGKVQRSPTRVSTADLVEEVFSLSNASKSFRLVHRDLPVLTTQLTPLRQVFLNLVGNAVKYHHRGEGVIEVHAKTRGQMIEFSVSDDGPGIDERFHEKIFVMFQRLHGDRDIPGSGMGLALVQKIVQNGGGEVTVASKPGKGSVFRFTWPKHSRQPS